MRKSSMGEVKLEYKEPGGDWSMGVSDRTGDWRVFIEWAEFIKGAELCPVTARLIADGLLRLADEAERKNV